MYQNGAWGVMSVEQYAELEQILYRAGVAQNFPIAEKRKIAWGNVMMRVPRLDYEMLDKDILLACPNGTLDPFTGTITTHSPDFYTTRRIMVPYDPDATCPEWEAMLLRCLEGKPASVQEEYIDYLQMAFGAALFGSTPDTPRDMRKATILWGKSDTGKTTIAEVLKAFFHPAEVADESIDQLGSQFGLQRVMSARALIADDVAKKKSKLDPAVLKKLITGESMTAQVKFQPNRSFRFRGPIMLTTNVRPEISDESNAMYNRLVVLKFDREFKPEDKAQLGGLSAVGFLKKHNQFPGILNWSIVGGRRLHNLGQFNRIGEAKENAKEWRAENDVVFDFVTRYGVKDKGAYCSVPLLAQMIATYAIEEHHAPKGLYPPKKVANLLVREVEASVPGTRVERIDRKDTSGNVILGLRINDEGVLWEARTREAGNLPHGVRWKLNGKAL